MRSYIGTSGIGGRYRVRRAAMLACLLTVCAQATVASDACSTRAVLTEADVAVSDGSAFRTRSWFHSRNAAAIRHVADDDTLIAVEGPLSWTRRGEESAIGAGFHASFALGHQHHALLLYFDDIVEAPRRNTAIAVNGETRSGRSGNLPYGGTVHLVEDAGRAVALVFELPDMPPIVHTFDDWRRRDDGTELPYRVVIDDGTRTFDYRFTAVDTGPRSPLWFFEAVDSPGLAEVEIYRLHRKLLAAHCLGDADLIADLSTDDVTVASRGELLATTPGEMRERFAALFGRLDYTGYIDLQDPVIRVSSAGDVGWIAVNVRAIGRDRQSGAGFDDRWAWAMLLQNDGGRWKHAGNASNRAP